MEYKLDFPLSLVWWKIYIKKAFQDIEREQKLKLDIRYFHFDEKGDGSITFYDLPRPLYIGDPSFPRRPQKVVVKPSQEDGLVEITVHADSDAVLEMHKATIDALLARVPGLTPITPTPQAHVEFRPIPDLSERETEVANLVARGYTNRQIADKLVISVYTVKKHCTNISAKREVVTPLGAYGLRDLLRQRGYGQA